MNIKYQKFGFMRLKLCKIKGFLETRAYLRQSLSTLFELDLLEIPINAQPVGPPTLPTGMGKYKFKSL